MVFKYLCILVLWTKVTLALEGLYNEGGGEMESESSLLNLPLMFQSCLVIVGGCKNGDEPNRNW